MRGNCGAVTKPPEASRSSTSAQGTQGLPPGGMGRTGTGTRCNGHAGVSRGARHPPAAARSPSSALKVVLEEGQGGEKGAFVQSGRTSGHRRVERQSGGNFWRVQSGWRAVGRRWHGRPKSGPKGYLSPPFKCKPPPTQRWAGFQLRRGAAVDTAPLASPPPPPSSRDCPEVTRPKIRQKMTMGFLESARRGGSETSSFAMDLVKKKVHFQCSKKQVRAFSAI